jgi:hypothetical protein
MNIWQKAPGIRNITLEQNSVYINTSLVPATNILFCLSNGINTNTEIPRYCKYSASTVHKILNALNSLQRVIQDRIHEEDIKEVLGKVDPAELTGKTIAAGNPLTAQLKGIKVKGEDRRDALQFVGRQRYFKVQMN